MKIAVLLLFIAAAHAQPTTFMSGVLTNALYSFLSNAPPLNINGLDSVMHSQNVPTQDLVVQITLTSFTAGNWTPLDDHNDWQKYFTVIRWLLFLPLGMVHLVGLLFSWFTNLTVCSCWKKCRIGGSDPKSAWQFLYSWTAWRGAISIGVAITLIFWIPLYRASIANYMFRNMGTGYIYLWIQAIVLLGLGLQDIGIVVIDKSYNSGKQIITESGTIPADSELRSIVRNVHWNLFYLLSGILWAYFAEKMFDITQSQSSVQYWAMFTAIGSTFFVAVGIFNIMSLGFGILALFHKKRDWLIVRLASMLFLGESPLFLIAACVFNSMPTSQPVTCFFYQSFQFSPFQFGINLTWLILGFIAWAILFIGFIMNVHYKDEAAAPVSSPVGMSESDPLTKRTSLTMTDLMRQVTSSTT